MGRLTRIFEKDNQKYVCIDVCGKKCVEGYSECHDCEPFANVMKKLAEYENLEEQGRLIVLPCKMGDTVYIIGSKYRRGYFEDYINTGRFDITDLPKLGNSVFLTEEEAEKALEEMEEYTV